MSLDLYLQSLLVEEMNGEEMSIRNIVSHLFNRGIVSEENDSEILGKKVSRRDFLKGAGALGAGAALGMSGTVMAGGEDYVMPGAVLAEEDPTLRKSWRNWHNPKYSDDVKEKQKELMDFNNRERIIFPDSVYLNSHVYYILEAKMGLPEQSHSIAENQLIRKNPGLNSFRDGCIDFFFHKNFQHARLNFASGLFDSANLTSNQRDKIQKICNIDLNQNEIDNGLSFASKACRYFTSASVNEKEKMLQYLVNTGLNKKEEENLFWNLGLYTLSEYNLDLENYLWFQAKNKNSVYQKLKKSMRFSSIDTTIA